MTVTNVHSWQKPLILKLDVTGQPVAWITWQRAVEYYIKNKVTWTYGNKESIEITGGISRMTGQPVKLNIDPVIAITGTPLAKASSKIQKHPRILNSTLFRRDGFRCAYCGSVMGHQKLSRDHVLPLSRGGRDTWLNIVTACKRCNHAKGNKTLPETGMSLLYTPYVPSRLECLFFSNRTRMLPSQYEYLLNTARTNEMLYDKMKTTEQEEMIYEKTKTHGSRPGGR